MAAPAHKYGHDEPEDQNRPELVKDEEKATNKLPLPTLAAMVVGSMVGAGVFSLPRNFGQATGVYGALIAWGIAGTGMLMLAFVFQNLAIRKPDLDAGVYAYAKAGFGDYLGFVSAFGYWASACVGNVTYWVLIKSTLGGAIPQFGEGNTIIAVALLTTSLAACSRHDDRSDRRERREQRADGGGRSDRGARFDRMDTNHDGVIERSEATGKMQRRFARFDANGDGKITKEEFDDRGR